MAKLRPEDIDSKRMLIHVRGAKGRKDRYTIKIYTHVSTKSLGKIKSPLENLKLVVKEVQ